MKVIFILMAVSFSANALADKMVKGYIKSDGTYVQPHIRSSPNNLKFDNYSSKGNSNPYTGKQGNVDPYNVAPPASYTPKPYNYNDPYNN